MASLFVSHSSRDAGAAEELRNRLLGEGYESFFLDFDPDHGIPGGRNWERELYVQLRRADGVIFLGSPDGVESKWCFAELALARSVGKPIFPIRIAGGSRHPLLDDLQWIDLSSGDEQGFERLWTTLSRSGFDPRDAFRYDPRRAPYPGLSPFQAADAAVFFGRGEEIDELLTHLHPTLERAAGRFVAVIGPSGSGKSSLVRAGLIPRLRRLPERWNVVPPFTPGEAPIAALAAALEAALTTTGAASGRRDLEQRLRRDPRELQQLVRELSAGREMPRSVLVVIDQAEELATLASERERIEFLDILRHGLEEAARLWVVATFRSEFLSRSLREPGFAHLIGASVVLGPLDRSRLPAVIERPAQRAGLEFDAGLVGRMVEDTQGGDALPLLAYTLQQLHERVGPDGKITDAMYDAIGGVLGALRSRADRLRDELARQAKGELVIPTMLELITLDPRGEPTRRRRSRADLSEAQNEVIQAFVEARLLQSEESGDDAIVEVAHEALLRVWAPLREAIEASRDRLRLRSEIERLALDWEAAGRPDSYLLADERVQTARRFLGVGSAESTLDLSELERAFLDASIARHDEERRAEQRRVRRTFVGMGIALVLISVAALLALWQSQNAADERDVARARELAARALTSLTVDPARSVRLAMDAAELDEGSAEDALRAAVAASHGIRTLRGHDADVMTAAYDPSGELIVTASEDRTARIWNARTGKPRLVLDGHRDDVNSAAFDADGGRVVTASDDETARIWDARTGEPGPVLRGHFLFVSSAAFDSQGDRVVTAGSDGTVRIWNARTGEQRRVLQADDHGVTSAAFDRSGDRIVSAGFDGTPRVWTLRGRGPPAELRGHPQVVTAAAFSRDGKLVVTAGGGDGSARLWESTTGKSLQTLMGHELAVVDADFDRDGERVVTAGTDGSVRVWDVATGGALTSLFGHRSEVNSAAFDPSGERLVTASADGTARIWDAESGRRLAVLRGHKRSGNPAVLDPEQREGVTDIAFDANGSRILTAGSDGIARIWRGGKSVRVLRGHGAGLTSAAFDAGGERAITSSLDGTARVWRLDGGASPVVLRGHEDGAMSAAFHPNRDLVLTAALGGGARIWAGQRLIPRTLRRVGTEGEGGLNGAAFSPDGTRLASLGSEVSGTSGGTVGIWNWENRGRTALLRGHAFEIFGVAFDRAGERVVTAGGHDGTARIWEVDGTELTVLRGHKLSVNDAVFDPTGRLVLTAGSDGTARVWDTSGRSLAVIRAHDGEVNRAEFHPDGKRIATAGSDGTARLYACRPCGSFAALRDEAARPPR
ncbi:MAG TPA: TIR domain-containing protein [Thermoleophilaceae bacterium]|nr:TIR domain-containing protein [Thermoleophilaceae bacterium]